MRSLSPSQPAALYFELAVAAVLDDKGKWAAAVGGAIIWGTGFGPFFGGWLIAQSGYAALAWLNVITASLAGLGFIWVGRRLWPKT